MMFSLADIDRQIAVFVGAAEQLEHRASEVGHADMSLGLWAAANAFRDAARSLERMIETAIEAEAREAMR